MSKSTGLDQLASAALDGLFAKTTDHCCASSRFHQFPFPFAGMPSVQDISDPCVSLSNKSIPQVPDLKRKLPRVPQVYGSLNEFQRRIKNSADRVVFARPYAMGSTIFAKDSCSSSFLYGRFSEEMMKVQKSWARNVLISTWNDFIRRCDGQLLISDELRLALSWFSGVDVFAWDQSYVSEFFIHLSRFGDLKKCLCSKSFLTKDRSN